MSQIDELASRLAQVERSILARATTPQLAHSSVEDGAILTNDVNGNLRAILGKLPDGTTGVLSVNGASPPVPSAPQVLPSPRGYAVSWDGYNADGSDIQPLDWSRVEVHASVVGGFGPTTISLQGTFETPQGGTLVCVVGAEYDPPTTTTYEVLLIARNTSGTASAASSRVLVDVQELAIDGAVLSGSDYATAEVGPTIVLGPSAYDGTSPAIAWDLNGNGVDWTEPSISADPETGELALFSRKGSLALVRVLLGGALDPRIDLSAWSTFGAQSSLIIDPETGQVSVRGHLVAWSETWVTPALDNGWVHSEPATDYLLQYIKGADGFVDVRGTIKLGVGTIFTLPPDYCPKRDFDVTVACDGGAARIKVFSNGVVNLVSYMPGGTNAWVSVIARFSSVD